MTIRRDHAALIAAGEISEREAAAILKICAPTLSRWRRHGFALQPVAPRARHVHARLVAYVRSEVEALARAIASAKSAKLAA